MLATKSKIAIVTLTSQDAVNWIDENVSVNMIDQNSFAIDRVFLPELIDAMTDDNLIEDQDFEIIEK